MDAPELARWKRFAAKGGIGRCTAIVDCVAEATGDLMFFENDEIVVLKPVEGQEGRFIGYCEGVVGRFSASDVRFHGKLKKPVAIRRISPTRSHSPHSMSSATSPTATSASHAPFEFDLPTRPTSPPTPVPVPTSADSSLDSPSTVEVSIPLETAPSVASGIDTSLPHTLGDFQEGTRVDHGLFPPMDTVDFGYGPRDTSIVSMVIENAGKGTPSFPLSPAASSSFAEGTVRPEDESRAVSMVEQSALDEEHSGRPSADFSDDGEFGIGMQFIQGLIGQPGARGAGRGSVSTTSGRATSVSSEVSVALPRWRSSSPLPPVPNRIPAEEEPQAGPSSVHRGVIATTTSHDPSPSPQSQHNPDLVDSLQVSVLPSVDSRSQSPSSRPLSTFLPSWGHSRSPSPPPQEDVSDVDGEESTSLKPLQERSSDGPNAEEAPIDDAGEEVKSPAVSSFPSESDFGRYYEEDLGIYDDYRYSRYSMMSRKSRKSIIPDPKAALEEYPLPTAVPTPPRQAPFEPLDHPPSPHSFAFSATSSIASPKGFEFLTTQIDQPPTRPLRISSKHSSPEIGGSVPAISPVPGSAKLASEWRKRIEMEERMQDDIEQSLEGRAEDAQEESAVDEEHSVVPYEDPEDLEEEVSEPGAGLNDTDLASAAEDEADEVASLRGPELDVELPPSSPSGLSHTSGDSQSTDLVVDEAISTIATPPPTAPLRIKSPPPSGTLPYVQVTQMSTQGAISPLQDLGTSAIELAPLSSPIPRISSPQQSALDQLEGRGTSVPPSPSAPLSPTTSLFAKELEITPGSTPYFSPSGRPLTFLPHPHAPKPAALSSLPSQPSIYQDRGPHGPPAPDLTLYQMMASAVSHYRMGRIRVTIHARTQIDLATAGGPVKIYFFLDPEGRGPPRGPMPPAQPVGGGIGPPHQHPIGEARPFPTAPSPGRPNLRVDVPVNTTSAGPGDSVSRTTVFPGTGGPRPRSRSFNDAKSTVDGKSPETPTSGKDEEKSRFRMPSLLSIRSSRSASATTPASQPAPSINTPRQSELGARSPKTPPPLAITRSSPAATAVNIRSPPVPSSPLARPAWSSTTLSPPEDERKGSTDSIPFGTSPRQTLRNIASTSGLRMEIVRPDQSLPSPSSIGHPVDSPIASFKAPLSPAISEPPDAVSSPMSGPVSLSNDDDSMRTPSISRSHSLRSKISIAALKSRQGRSVSGREVDGGSTPVTPSAQYEFSEETVQVKEGSAAAEFELVRPIIPRISEMRAVDENGTDIEQLSVRSDPIDAESHRSTSPVVSVHRRPTLETPETSAASDPTLTPSPSDTVSIEAHRAREQKWLSAMSSVPASSARKNKKVKKLVQEGIPNSVRSVVWLYLTNSKARRMDGLYAQLCGRGKVAASEEIQLDAERSFPSQPHLRDPTGPIVTLLQAYLIMVPDIQYHQGLAAMAGTILLQSPEEDAFWTFMALMDNHLRGYFATNSQQLEVDSKLLQRALETIDYSLARKLFVELHLTPVDICRPWFSALFSNTLPNRYLYRVWDIFICDGPTWIFRVALTLLLCCKRFITETPRVSAPEVLGHLLRPPIQVLHGDPDSFITAALTLKVKEDELRKLRPKIEISVKQQQQGLSPRTPIQPRDVRTITRIP